MMVSPRALFSGWQRRPWHWRKVEQASLARFVNPRCVAEVIPAVDPDGERTVHDTIHLDGDPLVIAEDVYQLISDREIDYDREGYVAETEAVQRIRTPIEIWERRRATCLDLALLYAGACLGEGLRPLVVVLDGHALSAVVDAQFQLPLPEPSDDADMLLGWIENGSVVPVESTGMANGEGHDIDFATAVIRGREAIESHQLDFFFDPQQLQQGGQIEPEPCHTVSTPRVAAAVIALLLLVGAGGWWLARPGPPVMAATGGGNLAVFPFAQSGDLSPSSGVALANELALSIRQEFKAGGELQSKNRPGWEVWGPSQLDATQSGAPVLTEDLGSQLKSRNIDVAVYGLIEEAGDRTFSDVNIWFQPSQRSSLGGLSGPVRVRRDTDGSNGSVAQVAGELAAELDGWFAVLSGLGVLSDAQTVDDLLLAREQFVDASTVGRATSDGGQLLALSELLTGGTHLLIDSTIGYDQNDARALNLGLATEAFEEALNLADGSNPELMARAHLGLAQVNLAQSGCAPDDHDSTQLDQADGAVAAARAQLDNVDLGPDPAELQLKTTLIDGRVQWCRWASGLSSGDQALVLLTLTIDDFEQRSGDDERQRTEHLASAAYALRALLRGQAGELEDPEASLDDALRAQCLAPELSDEFLRDEIRAELFDRYPNLAKESCRDFTT